MSSAPEDLIGSIDIAMISEILAEPCYISEVARKLQEANLPMGYDKGELESVESVTSTWGGVTHNTALVGVMITLSIMNADESRFDVVEVPYDEYEMVSEGGSQKLGSVHASMTADEGVTKDWEEYTIVNNPEMDKTAIGASLAGEGYQELASDLRSVVNPDMTIERKTEVVQELSRVGNTVSRHAEKIMQDVMERQFREYDMTEAPSYNDPGVDFKVKDKDRRDYGLVIEISTRWVNPVGDPYVSNKIQTALELEEDDVDTQPWDVLIMAPRFTSKVAGRYEDPEDPSWHVDPEEGMVHTHHVPSDDGSVYRPFATKPEDIEYEGDDRRGNPVVIPDSEELRENIQRLGNVADGYPIVGEEPTSYIDYLDGVFRDFTVVTESRYRNMIRESVEPLLWEFMRPYLIEQFLIDMYWDKELTQSQIGKLVDRSGSTIGTWMQKFGVMRRGTGAPELSDETIDIWKRMYEGGPPFNEQFSGYRIQAEYNRHPLWDLEDWEEWYQETTEEERKDVMMTQDTYRDNLDYTIMVGAKDRLQPSYTFILSTLREEGVEIREPDEAPRVPYSAYASKDSIEYMLNKDQNTIVDVSEEENGE